MKILPKIRRGVTVAVAVWLFTLAPLAAQADKPAAPLALAWHGETRITDGAGPAGYRLTLTVGAFAELSDLTVEFVLPKGMTARAGGRPWHGSLAKGGLHEATIDLGRDGAVSVRITATTVSNVHYHRTITITLPDDLTPGGVVVPRRKALLNDHGSQPTANPPQTGGLREYPSD